MASDLKDISLLGVSLEPIDGQAAMPIEGKSKFTANTRDKKGDRRQVEDRRKELRFQENRRANEDRRPVKTWEKGHNL